MLGLDLQAQFVSKFGGIIWKMDLQTSKEIIS